MTMKMLLVSFFVVTATFFGQSSGEWEVLKPQLGARKLSESRQSRLVARYVPWQWEDKELQVALQVEDGEKFVIPLFENGTTGYQWQVSVRQPKMPLVKMLSSDFILPREAKGMAGAGGLRLFTFQTAERGGSAILVFRYVRPWEKKAAPVQQLTVFLTVPEDGEDND